MAETCYIASRNVDGTREYFAGIRGNDTENGKAHVAMVTIVLFAFMFDTMTEAQECCDVLAGIGIDSLTASPITVGSAA